MKATIEAVHPVLMVRDINASTHAGLDRTEVWDTAWGTREFHVPDLDGNGLQFYRCL